MLRNADAIVYCRAANDASDAMDVVRSEVAAAGIEKPSIVALTKFDELPDAAGSSESVVDNASLSVVPVSVLDDASLDRLREAIWSLTSLIRVFPRRDGEVDEEPFALPAGASVAEMADRVHHELAESCTGARVWGTSARFDGQRVGRRHVLADGDVVVVLVR